ncbi:hypothetical protein KY290_027537 [Solanum tuberosum]|uniref:CCHC-type domain-containing protein n=1 Tax=Solanum tuberosum TaxID=4113 RepID=A0ABQ7UFC6_SOLTU|nr:hypothetical protein KY285_026473 [Solanum tuberosum]KAH0748305.1 hypothetical protein KY290_027537 [Solanum tuberosum]
MAKSFNSEHGVVLFSKGKLNENDLEEGTIQRKVVGNSSQGYKSIRCHRCGKLRHIQRYCRVMISKVNVACEDYKDDEPKWEHCFTIEDVEIKDNVAFESEPNKSHINYVYFKEEWIVESGCIHHSCDNIRERVIVTADNSTYPVMKEGVVEIGINDTNIKLNDVYHVPDDVKVLGSMKYIEADVLFAGTKKGFLFVMSAGEAYVKKTSQIDNAAICHARLGHLGYQMLQKISSDKFLDGMPPLKNAQEK